MGGKVFSTATHPLSTPRMPPEIYRRLCDYYLNRLLAFFLRVATPLESPQKDSYGDIDILVSSPLPNYSREALAKTLGATQASSNGSVVSYAVPYPNFKNNFVQIDVQVCPDKLFDWQVFHQSHGDLWNILRPSLRTYGLMVNDQGLNLRIAEIAKFDRKKSMLFLTSNPNSVLGFLGLDQEEYNLPFETKDALFKYICQTRFFRPEAYNRRTLGANDRKRIMRRELFKQFVDEYLPSMEEKNAFERQEKLNVPSVSDEAVQKFEKGQDLYDRLKGWRHQRGELRCSQAWRQAWKDQILEKIEYTDAWIGSLKEV
ncbi:MAG: hypothetical protein Q9190_004518 [Brigantiaea leucoxantha]